jgi:hypothetical protein
MRDVSAVEEAVGDPDMLDSKGVENIPDIIPEDNDAEAAEEEHNSLDTDADVEANAALSGEGLPLKHRTAK